MSCQVRSSHRGIYYCKYYAKLDVNNISRCCLGKINIWTSKWFTKFLLFQEFVPNVTMFPEEGEPRKLTKCMSSVGLLFWEDWLKWINKKKNCTFLAYNFKKFTHFLKIVLIFWASGFTKWWNFHIFYKLGLWLDFGSFHLKIKFIDVLTTNKIISNMIFSINALW